MKNGFDVFLKKIISKLKILLFSPIDFVRASFLSLKKSKKVFVFDWYKWVNVDLSLFLKSQYIIYSPDKKQLLPKATHYNLSVDINKFNYKDYVHDGLYLWEICKSSICDHLCKVTIDEPADFEIVELYYNKAICLINSFTKLYEQKNPNAIIVEQGFQYDMRVAVEIARRFNCKTVAIENSFLKDYFFMDACSGGICNRHFLARNAWDVIKARHLDSFAHQHLRSFLLNYSTTISKGINSSSVEELRIKVTKGSQKKIALLIGQVATDAAIIMDSYIYPDILDFIEDAAQIMSQYRDDYQLVIRLHPKESYGTNHHGVPFDNMTLKRLKERGIDQLDHVTVFHSDQVNTYQLMDIAEFGLAINSQAGLEFLSRYKPLIVLGDAFYAHKGFTRDVSCKEAFAIVVQKVIENPLMTEDQKRAIDSFLHFMIFDYLYPKELSNSQDRIHALFS
ncbi:capsular polysaccharide export protein, LipB/KpsS family [Umezakia ovalisporum]|uniref:Uncharacterized protein n=1 Tax=Umezakia ovalisporum FSS-43 TaxID=2740520 RepID=A0ABT6K739_9CYAN|nr:hypothetical protein [Umezakia ovalisporum]MDH6058057.1 hypothetical protein [Umezakia ovalisporum FSS-43]MDH6066703.1 hypothetical protein [Umezakia ovalisporum APH033B]MDH6071546.1 hypothetical protein [Umezakia ovalisporum CobakiLakeA]MDH6073503.1 hypothetical protein [Umezakia ovalisporum CS-1034]MDH6080886.1 hypothetical protein [Umezakia ovalisporum FSS-44]